MSFSNDQKKTKMIFFNFLFDIKIAQDDLREPWKELNTILFLHFYRTFTDYLLHFSSPGHGPIIHLPFQ